MFSILVHLLSQPVIEPPMFDPVYLNQPSLKRFASLFSQLRRYFSSLVLLAVLAELSGEVFGVLRIGVMLTMVHPLINNLLGCDARSQNGVPVEDVRSEP